MCLGCVIALDEIAYWLWSLETHFNLQVLLLCFIPGSFVCLFLPMPTRLYLHQ